MKILITAINSKFIQSNLAIWYLKAACESENIFTDVCEFTINDLRERILADLYRKKPDIICFSCYIWNISMVQELSKELKNLLPKLVIIWGGPEVSYDSLDYMQSCEIPDYIISGEGEQALPQLLNFITSGENNDTTLNTHKDIINCCQTNYRDNPYKLQIQKSINIFGLTYRDKDRIIQNKGFNLVSDLNSIPSPYSDEMLSAVRGRLFYFEASRGCPFSCSYCISSTFTGVRYFSLDRIKGELTRIVQKGVKIIKFVDRTFNANLKFAKDIVKFIVENFYNVTFHFEVAGDIFDDELLEMLVSAPKGLIQLEIGLQSCNERTLETVSRKTNIGKVINNVKRLLAKGNIHIHLDLIAGLPYEDLNSFENSFNKAISYGPHDLQLGFLKMLRGSEIRNNANSFQYKFRKTAPYEILENEFISFEDILKLKDIEELLERYYNSGRFFTSMKYLIEQFNLNNETFSFFMEFSKWYRQEGYYDRPIALKQSYGLLLLFVEKFYKEFYNDLTQLLSIDFLLTDNSGKLPEPLEIAQPHYDKQAFTNISFSLLANDQFVKEYLPEYLGLPSKQIYKNVKLHPINADIADVLTKFKCADKNSFVDFDVRAKDMNYHSFKDLIEGVRVVLIDYGKKDPVTERYEAFIIS